MVKTIIIQSLSSSISQHFNQVFNESSSSSSSPPSSSNLTSRCPTWPYYNQTPFFPIFCLVSGMPSMTGQLNLVDVVFSFLLLVSLLSACLSAHCCRTRWSPDVAKALQSPCLHCGQEVVPGPVICVMVSPISSLMWSLQETPRIFL